MFDIGKTGIIPFSNFGDRSENSVGSSHLRAFGIVNRAKDKDFEIWEQGAKYDNLIFQKVYWKEMMNLFKGPKILDICDPDWIHGGVNIVEIGNLSDAITCSSNSLTTLLQKYFSNKLVVHIPDRLNFKMFPEARSEHKGQAKKVVWFGFIHNAEETLGQILPAIRKYKLNLKIIADQELKNSKRILKGIDFQFVKYEHESAYCEIKDGDIVINPKSNRAFYKFKSNNKSIISWKLGLPVAENSKELERFLSADERNIEVSKNLEIVNLEYDILKSIDQYKEIINTIRSQKY